jgi:Protein of unknown function (DUF3108)
VRQWPEPRARARRLQAAALAAALGVALTRLAAGAELKPYEASYSGVWHGMTVAVSTLTLERSGDTWTYTSKSEPRGLGRMASGIFPPLQVSVVKVTAAGVLAQSFRSEGGEASKAVNLKYDWQSHKVTGSYQGTTVDLPLTPQVQDDGSVQLALMAELIAGRTPAGLQLIDRDSVRDYAFTREGEATLATPMGAVPTVIYRAQKAYSPRVTRFWCAPGSGYIPMKVEQTKGDDVQWTLQIQSLKRD